MGSPTKSCRKSPPRNLALVQSNPRKGRENVLRWLGAALASELVRSLLPQMGESVNRTKKLLVFREAARSLSFKALW